MVKEILKTYRRLKQKKQMKYCEVDKTVILDDNFFLDVRNPKKNKKYLKVGKNCILSGQYIFEKESGYITIGDRCSIGGGTSLISVNQIEIGNDVVISWDCTIYDHNSHSIYWNERKDDIINVYHDLKESGNPIANKRWDVVKSAPIKICDKVWIGFGVTILKGVTIGEGAVIGAKSVVVKDVEPYTVVGGNPARVLKKL